MEPLSYSTALFAEASEIITRGALGWTLVVAVAIAAIHLLVPRLQPFVKAHEELLNSIGRGLAVAYTFLYLFHEMCVGSKLLGPQLHLLVLLGFLVYYGVEHVVETQVSDAADDPSNPMVRLQFRVLILLKWVYSWLIIYALPEAITSEGIHAITMIIAISLHILHDDVELATRFERHYSHFGRYLLASAPIVGWVCDLFMFEKDLRFSKILMALLAGSILYTTFSGEFREHRKSRFKWFLFGVLIYIVLYFLSGFD